MKYEVSYISHFDSKENKQTRDTLEEAVAYALILNARKDLNVEVLSIKKLEDT